MRTTIVFVSGLLLGAAALFLLASLGVVGEGGPHGRHVEPGEGEGHEGEGEERGLIRLAEGAVELAGIRVEPAATGALERRLSLPAEVQIPPARLAHVGPRLPGVIHEIRKELGARVEPGDVLAVLDSVAMGEAKSAYLRAQAELELAEKTLAREKELVEQGAAARKALFEAETAVEKARIERRTVRERLHLLGLTDEQVASVPEEKGEARAHVPVLATFAGVIIDKHAAPGELVHPEEPLFTIADLTHLWVIASVAERDLHLVRTDVDVEVRVAAHPGAVFPGALTYLDPRVDPKTRRVRARVEAANGEGKLRPAMFAEVSVPVALAVEAVVVPREAVQRVDGRTVVFVARDGGRAFEVREVRTGLEASGRVAIERGLEAGEPVAVTGAFLLKSEAEKARIGEGHAH